MEHLLNDEQRALREATRSFVRREVIPRDAEIEAGREIFSDMGYTKDLPIERMFRDLRLLRIVEGTSEIQRLIIARAVLEQ